MNPTLSETIGRARGGDVEAFGRIVRQYQSLVSGVLFSATGDFHQSEDFCQETFLIAWNRLGDLRDDDNLAAWLCTIARNLVHRSHRKKSANVVYDSFEEKLPSSEKGPDAELLQREQSDLVWSAIGDMDEKYRETLVLYYRSGRSVHEIAAAMDSTEDAVKQRLVRARKSLKVRLEQMIGDVLSETAPGEAFTFGVIAAITGSLVSVNTGTALAGTVSASTVGTTAAAVGSTKGAMAAQLVLPAATVIASQAVSGGMLWASIRNTPTLRSRRLQVYNFFWGCQYFSWFLAAAMLPMLLFPAFFPSFNGPLWPAVMQVGVMLIVMPVTMMLTYRSSRRYQQMIEYELGLPGPRPRVYSFPEVENRFHRSVISNILLLETIPLIALFPNWYAGLLDHWSLSLMVVAMFMGLGVVLFAYNYGLGKAFLRMCRCRESFLNAPPLIREPLKAVLRNPQGMLFADPSSKMSWLNAAPWLLMIPAAVFFLPRLSWNEHPMILGLCVAGILGGSVWGLRRIRKAENFRKATSIAIVGELLLVATLLVIAATECGGLSVTKFVKEASAGSPVLIGILVFVGLTFVFLPIQLLILYFELRRTRENNGSDRAEAVREAMERFDPTAFVDDEPVAPAQRFPRRWIAMFVLYGIAVAGLMTLGVYFPSPRGYYQRGVVKRFDDPRQAIKDFDAAIAWSPRYARAYCQRALARAHLGFDLRLKDKNDEADREFATALKDCETAIRLDDHDPEPWDVRAGIFEWKKDWNAAVAALTEAFRRSGKADFLKRRAEIHEKLDDHASAEADYTEAIRVNRESIFRSTTWFYLGRRAQFYEKIGEKEKALADYDETIRECEQKDSVYRSYVRDRDKLRAN